MSAVSINLKINRWNHSPVPHIIIIMHYSIRGSSPLLAQITPHLEFLGILLDTSKQEISLSQQKLEDLKRLVSAWKERSSCTKRELLQLIGKLAHATKVVMPGCTFLRCMIDTAMTVKHLDHHIKLRSEFASDLAWWDCFLPSWNSKSMMAVHGKGWNPHIVFSTDASGSWGCGAIRQTR